MNRKDKDGNPMPPVRRERRKQAAHERTQARKERRTRALINEAAKALCKQWGGTPPEEHEAGR